MSQKINTPEPEDGDSHDGPVVATAQLGSVLSPQAKAIEVCSLLGLIVF